MGKSVSDGVVDEFGHVFDKSNPTALGVNPSLTISALALRAADKIIDEVNATS
jgi:hypothetical protein